MENVPCPLLRGFISSFVWRRVKKRLLWLSRTENYLVRRGIEGRHTHTQGRSISELKGKAPFFGQLGQSLTENKVKVNRAFCLFFYFYLHLF